MPKTVAAADGKTLQMKENRMYDRNELDAIVAFVRSSDAPATGHR
jgi:hypothetical protein